MTEKLVEGFLHLKENHEYADVLFLETESGTEPLAELLEDLHNEMVTIRYYISNEKVTHEEAEEKFLQVLFGKLDAVYAMHYSECTGYLWTTENLTVGGHDLLTELVNYTNRYLILIIEIHKET
jgi:hypothetical protein